MRTLRVLQAWQMRSAKDESYIRVGNDEYARENRSYGLTTLRRKHVQVQGTLLRFSFRGKSGVEHCVAVDDPRLARIVQRCQDMHGQEIFQYLDSFGKRRPILSDDVNDYLREVSGRDITAKDFRTWGGTMVAAVTLRAMGPAASRSEADRNIVRALDAVAERLGNTRAVCRKYYVHPVLLDAYHLGLTAPAPRRSRSAPAARRRKPHCGATSWWCCNFSMSRLRSLAGMSALLESGDMSPHSKIPFLRLLSLEHSFSEARYRSV